MLTKIIIRNIYSRTSIIIILTIKKTENLKKNMQGNKENEDANKPQQKKNKFNINYYTNMSGDEFEVFCKRLVTLHQTGVYIPPPPKPRACKNKKRVQRGPREYIPKKTKTLSTFGQGRVGVSCESFGIKNCSCCQSSNEAQQNVRILRSILADNKPLDKSEVYELKIQEIMAGNNRNKNTKKNINKAVFKINQYNENKEDSFNKYDKKIEDFIVKTEMFEKRLQDIVSKYNTTEIVDIVEETVLEENSEYEHDYCNKNTIIIDDENYLPSTSFVKSNNSELKLIDEIIVLDSDNEDTNTNTSKTNKISASNGLNLNKKIEPTLRPVRYKIHKTDKTKYTVNVNHDCTTAVNLIVDQKNEPFTSNVSIEQNLSSNIEMLNSVRNKEIDKSASNTSIISINDSFTETNNKEPERKSSPGMGLGILDCPICLEPLKNKEIMSTICGHIFCSPCITTCIRQTKKCPNCRKPLTLKRIHPIFF